MASPNLQQQIEKTLKPFEERRKELAAKRSHVGSLRAQAEELQKEAVRLQRSFDKEFGAEWANAVKSLVAGTATARDIEIRDQAQLVHQKRTQSSLAYEAASQAWAEVDSLEDALAHEVDLALRPVWQQVTGELYAGLSTITQAMVHLGEAYTYLGSRQFQKVQFPISAGFFFPMRVDEETQAKRWLEYNAGLGLLKPELVKRAA
jgi:DNA-binding protein YbaB